MSITEPQKKRGRPATGETPQISVRLPVFTLAKVELFAETRGIARAEAVRQLVEKGLAYEDLRAEQS